MDVEWRSRGVSSAGRAPALQAGGHRFDPGTLHTAHDRRPDVAIRRHWPALPGTAARRLRCSRLRGSWVQRMSCGSSKEVQRVTVKRMDNVGIVVDDLAATIAFFRELGL